MVSVIFQSVRKQIRLQTVKERLLSLNYAVIEFPSCAILSLVSKLSASLSVGRKALEKRPHPTQMLMERLP